MLHLAAVAALALTCGCGNSEEKKETKEVAQTEQVAQAEQDVTAVAENDAATPTEETPAEGDAQNPTEEATTTVAQGESVEDEGASKA